MHIRLAANPVVIGEAVRGTVALDGVAGGCRRLVVQLVRRETVDRRTVEETQELLRMERRTDEAPIAGDVGFVGPTDGQLPTYSGARFSVDHRIEVAAETLSGERLRGRGDVVLGAGPGLPVAPAPPTPWTLAPLVGGGFLAAAVTLVVVSRGALEPSLAGLVNAVIGVALLAPAWRRRQWGAMRVVCEPRRPALGAAMSLRVEVRRRRAWTATRVVAALEAEEAVDVPEADGHSVERRGILVIRQVLFEGARTVGAGEAVTFGATLEIPSGAPPTFRAGSGRVEWQVRLSLEAASGGRDEVQALVVVPPGRGVGDGTAGNGRTQEISEERS